MRISWNTWQLAWGERHLMVLRDRPHIPSGREMAAAREAGGFGALAQLGERLLCKQGVVGSIPTGSTSHGLGGRPERGSVAQVVRAYA